ncbi:uncharacterized protein FIBRA_05238 [Fibroporia radiculosa]|uniref:Protein YOP1 n=1 Tax=Fibroporia radiculosa TaxID=599839 RepID=J4HX68_9APHY|nr:uncharacterized protein FIBRA_05238 [Fibroporia radiculosa]CCM03117.1 predicted protein [Fibroporia radiculosa]
MFTSLASNLLSAWFAYLLPCYETWKSLSHRPTSEQELERWAMYWSVVGAIVAFEHVAEWLVSWLPLYWEIKTAFLLFLSLSQTQGSTWVYKSFVDPYLISKEAEIDAGIVQAKANIIAFLQDRTSAIWQSFLEFAASQLGQTQNAVAPGSAPPNPMAMAQGLFSTLTLLGNLPAHQRPTASPAYSSSSIHSVESSDSSAASSSYSSEAPVFPEPERS